MVINTEKRCGAYPKSRATHFVIYPKNVVIFSLVDLRSTVAVFCEIGLVQGSQIDISGTSRYFWNLKVMLPQS